MSNNDEIDALFARGGDAIERPALRVVDSSGSPVSAALPQTPSSIGPLTANSVLNWVNGTQAQAITPASLSGLMSQVPSEDQAVLLIEVLNTVGKTSSAATVAAAEAQVKLITVAVDKLAGLPVVNARNELEITEVQGRLNVLATVSGDVLAQAQATEALKTYQARKNLEVGSAKADMSSAAELGKVQLAAKAAEIAGKRERGKLDAASDVLPVFTAAERIDANTTAKIQLREARTRAIKADVAFYGKYALYSLILIALIIGAILVSVKN